MGLPQPPSETHQTRRTPSLCFQHVPFVSVNVLSLKTGSLTRATSSGCTTGPLLFRSKLENASIEFVSRPETKTAFSMRVAYLFAL